MRKLLSIIFTIAVWVSFAQDKSQFLQEAKKAVESRNLEEALHTVEVGLDRYPTDHDLRAYQARILLWQGQYEIAEQKIELLLAYYPEDYEGLTLKTTGLWWQEEWVQLRNTSQKALEIYTDDSFFQEKLLISLHELKQHKQVRSEYSNIKDKNDRIESLNFESKLNYHQRMGTSFNYAYFSNSFSPWILTKLEYHKETNHSWSVTGTYGSMFDETGTMIEGTLYPKISPKLTGYINASFSNSSIFPTYRVGGELVGTIGKAEITGGSRWMNFKETDKDIFIYTAGIGAYLGKFYGSYKAYLADFQGNTENVTHTLFLRRTLDHRYHYIQLNLSEGTTPLQVNNFSEISRLEAMSAYLNYYRILGEKYLVNAGVGWQREEYNNGKRDRIDVSAGVSLIF